MRPCAVSGTADVRDVIPSARSGAGARRRGAAVVEHLVGDVRTITGCAGPNDLTDASGALRISRDIVPEACGRTRYARDRHGPRPPGCKRPSSSTMSTAHQSANSGTARWATVLQRRLVVERARERRAGLGEKRRLPIRALGVFADLALLVVQLRARDCGGRHVAERARGVDLDVAERVPGAVVEDERTAPLAADDAAAPRASTRSPRAECVGTPGEHRSVVDRLGDDRLRKRHRCGRRAALRRDDGLLERLGNADSRGDPPCRLCGLVAATRRSRPPVISCCEIAIIAGMTSSSFGDPNSVPDAATSATSRCCRSLRRASAAASAASARRRSLMSRAIFDAPIDPAVGIADRRDGQRDRDERAVFALPQRFVMFDRQARRGSRDMTCVSSPSRSAGMIVVIDLPIIFRPRCSRTSARRRGSTT